MKVMKITVDRILKGEILVICLFLAVVMLHSDVHANAHSEKIVTKPIHITEDHTTLENITIRYSGAEPPITISDTHDVKLKNIKIIGSPEANGIHIENSSHIEMDNINVSSTKDGVYLEHVEHIKMKQITSQNNRYGIHFMYVTYGELNDSVVRDNVTGIMLMVSDDIKLSHNKITDQQVLNATGMTLYKSSGIQVRQNNLFENSTALSIQEMSQSEIINNSFTQNLTGIEIYQSDIPIQKNRFSNNISIANIDQPQSQFRNNMYDDPSIMDLDGDGTGDTPKRFSNLLGEVMVKDTTLNFFQNGPLHILLQWIEDKSITLESGYQDTSPKMLYRDIQLNIWLPILVCSLGIILLTLRRIR